MVYPGGSLRHSCCSDPQDPCSLPVAEHLPHVHGASCSQVPAVVPVALSVALPDPQYPEKWDLSSVPQCMPGFLRDPLPHILGPATPMHLTELPPWSILFHALKNGDISALPEAQERRMVHLDTVGEQERTAGTGAAW